VPDRYSRAAVPTPDRRNLGVKSRQSARATIARLPYLVSLGLQRLGSTAAAQHGSAALDRATLFSFRVRPPTGRHFDHVVLATEGNGNIGDQALLESYLQATAGKVAVLVASSTAHRLPDTMVGRGELVVLRGLTDTRALLRRGARRRFAEILTGASTFTVIGADLMDGGYHRREAVLRSDLLTFASRLGVATRLVSFSWNGLPDRYALRALRRAAETTTLFVRDPESLARLQLAGVPNLVPSSDIVFGHRGTTPVASVQAWLHERHNPAFVIVNISGLIGLDEAKIDGYVKVVTWLLGRGYAVILLPHVIRAGDDDLSAATAVKARCTDSAVHLVSELLRPSDVAWLAGEASGVLTGRMHLAVLGMKQGTPCAVFGTQGKVEGLLRLVGLSKLLLQTGPTMAASAQEALQLILDDPSLRDRLADRLPEVIDLARKPLADLDNKDALTPRQGMRTWRASSAM
jgi:colanic acid/amylovoran biosynthesis protein